MMMMMEIRDLFPQLPRILRSSPGKQPVNHGRYAMRRDRLAGHVPDEPKQVLMCNVWAL
jgi:hypothetical protein